MNRLLSRRLADSSSTETDSASNRLTPAATFYVLKSGACPGQLGTCACAIFQRRGGPDLRRQTVLGSPPLTSWPAVTQELACCELGSNLVDSLQLINFQIILARHARCPRMGIRVAKANIFKSKIVRETIGRRNQITENSEPRTDS